MKNKRAIIIFSAITLLLFAITLTLTIQLYSKHNVITEQEEKISTMENQISKLRNSYRNVTPTPAYGLPQWQEMDTSKWEKVENKEMNVSFLCPPEWKCTSFEDRGKHIILDKGKDSYFFFSINISKVTQADIAESYYPTVIAWYEGLKTNPKKATLSTKDIYGAGSHNIPPFFMRYEEKNIQFITLNGEQGLSIKKELNDFDVLIMRENNQLYRFGVAGGQSPDYSLIMTIISTIKETN